MSTNTPKEALEPVNNGETFANAREGVSRDLNTLPVSGPSKEDVELVKNYLLAGLEAAKADQSKALATLDAEVEAIKARDIRLGNKLPPIVQAIASKIVHYNMDIASCSPPQVWKTLCGWHHHRSDFISVTKASGLNTCKKCWDLAQSNRVRFGEVSKQAS